MNQNIISIFWNNIKQTSLTTSISVFSIICDLPKNQELKKCSIILVGNPIKVWLEYFYLILGRIIST